MVGGRGGGVGLGIGQCCFGRDDRLRRPGGFTLDGCRICVGAVRVVLDGKQAHQWGNIAVFAKIATGKDRAEAQNMRSGVKKGVGISLGRDRLLILDGFVVTKRGSKIHKGGDHTVEVADHVVEDVRDGHV